MPLTTNQQCEQKDLTWILQLEGLEQIESITKVPSEEVLAAITKLCRTEPYDRRLVFSSGGIIRLHGYSRSEGLVTMTQFYADLLFEQLSLKQGAVYKGGYVVSPRWVHSAYILKGGSKGKMSFVIKDLNPFRIKPERDPESNLITLCSYGEYYTGTSVEIILNPQTQDERYIPPKVELYEIKHTS